MIDVAIGLFFQPTGFTPANYDETIKHLEDAGAGFGNVPGRVFHCAMETNGNIEVFDVWESMEAFQAFGETLLPIMSKLGADPRQPQIMTIHNLQNG